MWENSSFWIFVRSYWSQYETSDDFFSFEWIDSILITALHVWNQWHFIMFINLFLFITFDLYSLMFAYHTHITTISYVYRVIGWWWWHTWLLKYSSLDRDYLRQYIYVCFMLMASCVSLNSTTFVYVYEHVFYVRNRFAFWQLRHSRCISSI